MNPRQLVDERVEKAKQSVSGFSEDLIDLYHTLLESQRKGLYKIAEQTTTANLDRITTVFLPAIKKLARDSLLTRIVGVQPISSRTTMVKMIDYVYSDDHAPDGISAGDSAIDKPSRTYADAPAEATSVTKGIDFVVKEIPAVASAKKLSGKWSFESSQDASEGDINIEKELTKAMANKIVEEINFSIIMKLYDRATGATRTWNKPTPADAPDVKTRKEKELYYNIVDVAAEIYDKTRRYPNYVIMSPRTAAFLKRSGDYVSTNSGSGVVSAIKRLFLQGTLSDEFDAYVVPNLPTSDILVGYKGSSELETGAIYAPYIPLVITESFYNVESWNWIRGVGSFYAESYVMMDLYGIVKVA